MKIMHIAMSLSGGPASYLEEIVPHQMQRYGPASISLVLPADELSRLAINPMPEALEMFPSRRRNLATILRFTRAFLVALGREKPDIVHLHSTFAGAICRLLLLVRPGRPKIVYCPHGWAFIIHGGRNGWLNRAAGPVERFLGRFTDRIVNVSKAELRAAEERGVGLGRNRVVRNAVSHEDMPRASRPDRQRALGMDPGKTNILFVGRLDRQKGIDIAFGAVRDLSPEKFSLHVIGDYVVDAPASLEVPAVVSMLGWQPRATTLAHIAAADLVIMPSRWEGLPLVAVEAMRAATAVLASRDGAFLEVVQDGVTGRLATMEAADEFRAALLETPKETWWRYGAAAREVFVAEFTAEQMNAELDAMYEELLSEARGVSVPASDGARHNEL